MMGKRLGSLAIGLGLLCTPVTAPAEAPEGTQARMTELIEALRIALPLSLSADDFASPANQPKLERALRRLRDGAGGLAMHGKKGDVGFSHLSSTLAADAAEIHRRFVGGRVEEARFLLGELSSDCVACHARLPYKRDSEIGRALWNAVDVTALPLDQRVRLQVATRQFGPALESYESLLRSQLIAPSQLDLGGYLSDYLAIAIRVRGDLARPRRQLDAWRRRPDVPAYLQDLAKIWVDALGTLDGPHEEGQEVHDARTILDQGKQLRRFPADRASLVHDLVASGLLHRWVTRLGEPTAASADAYYLLGVTELRIGSTYWLTEPESYLEAAIRAAPGRPTARDAYIVLEEATWLGYTGGGSPEELPPEIARWLEALRSIALTPAAEDDSGAAEP
jgi:hypothetical protein